jgi:Protein of unknown function (DUF3768)
MPPDTSARIRELNDRLRKDPYSGHGRVMVTASVNARGPLFAVKMLAAVAAFDAFAHGNDPYREHDFGVVDVDGTRVYFKIDYYDLELHFGSEDPSDPAKTTRVMTLMLPDDY